MSAVATTSHSEVAIASSKNHNKYRREKPWDEDPNIDRWKIEPWNHELPGGSLMEESSFATVSFERTKAFQL